jgi:hypothetical protein
VSATGSEAWGEVETEPEVDAWLLGLSDHGFGHVAFYIDLLAARGVFLGEPYPRQLDAKLRELRFYMGTEVYRISYYIATGRRIILLTVFPKDQPREDAEIERARRAMVRCIAEGHTAEG